MSLRINHNISSINGARNMIRNDMNVSKSLEKLSSGLRINKAADDAAGLVISEQMRAQVAGLDQAVKNSETAATMVQTAEGAIDEMNTLMNKARQLALHAANAGVNDVNQLTADQAELDNIILSVTRQAENTQFGTKKLLDGTLSGVTSNNASVTNVSVSDSTIKTGVYDLSITASTQLLSNISGTSGVNVTSLSTTSLNSIFTVIDSFNAISANTLLAQTTNVTITGTSISISLAAGRSLGDLLSAVNAAAAASNVGITYGLGATGVLTAKATDGGTYANGLDLNIAAGATTLTYDVSGGAATAAGVNAASELKNSAGDVIATTLVQANRGLAFKSTDTTLDARYTISSAVGLAAASTITGAVTFDKGAVFQIGANRDQTTALAIRSMKASALGSGATVTNTALSSLDALRTNAALTNGNAQDAISVIDKVTDQLTVQRGKLGATQADTLESTLNSLRTTHENLTSAESTIRDVDFAAESAMFTKNQILMQSATAMLAQANQLPQNVLKLLG